MSTDHLQKMFRTLGDPTRVRILALLEQEELAVHELMAVLGMAQSRVSRHLGILREAGLLQDRRDGTYALYRFERPDSGAWSQAWALARRELDRDPVAERDRLALARVLENRAARSRSFFDAVGPEWDALRKVWNDDILRARALGRALPRDLVALDLGTGTGTLALELAGAGMRVIAVDHSKAMLDAAQRKLEGSDAPIELRRGEATALPLADAEVDVAFAHLVLQYLPVPGRALAELARVVKPGGAVVVVDFLRHDREWMRQELGVVWLGFAPDEVVGWLREAGFEDVRLEVQPPALRSGDLPATFIADARRPVREPDARRPVREPDARHPASGPERGAAR
jgi:ArsR family transcriptional regulator